MLAIVTADNAGKLGKGKYNAAKLLGGPDIEYYHQAIAVIVAERTSFRLAAPPLPERGDIPSGGISCGSPKAKSQMSGRDAAYLQGG